MGLGMMMLSPSVISLPVKLLLFVMVDGWALVCGALSPAFAKDELPRPHAQLAPTRQLL